MFNDLLMFFNQFFSKQIAFFFMLFLVSLTAQQVINDGKDGAAISGDSPSGPDPVGGN